MFYDTFWATLLVALISIFFFVTTWRITDRLLRVRELKTFIKPLATETYLNLWRINRLVEYYDDLISVLKEPDNNESERIIEKVLSRAKEIRIPRYFVLRKAVMRIIMNSGSLRFFNLTFPLLEDGKFKFAKPDTVRELLVFCMGAAEDVESAVYWYNMVPGLSELPNDFLIKNLETAKTHLIDSFNTLNNFLYILIWNSPGFTFENFNEYKKRAYSKKVICTYLASDLGISELNATSIIVCWKNDIGLPAEKVIEMSGFTSIIGTG